MKDLDDLIKAYIRSLFGTDEQDYEFASCTEQDVIDSIYTEVDGHLCKIIVVYSVKLISDDHMQSTSMTVNIWDIMVFMFNQKLN